MIFFFIFLPILSLARLSRNTCNVIDVMLSKAKHLAFFRLLQKSRFFG